MRVQAAELRRQSVAGFTLATEVADWLAKRGVPFATAHEITGALVRRCEDLGVGLAEIGDADLGAVDPRLTPDIKACLTPEAAVAARVGYGGTAPVRVREQLDRLSATLDAQRRWAAATAGPRG
jgi:argininosuccinate lyase